MKLIEDVPGSRRVAFSDTRQPRLENSPWGNTGVGDPVYLGQWPLLHSATLTDPTDPRTLWRITVKQGTDMKRRLLLAAVAAAIALPVGAQTITLNGASQFNDDHAFTRRW